MFSLESPHRGDSNEYTQYTIFNINTKSILNNFISAAMRFFSKGLKNEFETAMVNESSVFEPLKFYCNRHQKQKVLFRWCWMHKFNQSGRETLSVWHQLQ